MDVYGQSHVAKVQGAITWSGFAAHALLIITTLSAADAPELSIVRDGNRQVRALEDETGAEVSIQVDAYPFSDGTAGNNTLANAATALALPPRPGVVTLSGITEPSVNAYNGDWLYLGGGSSEQSEGIARVSFRLHRLNLAAGITNALLATKITA